MFWPTDLSRQSVPGRTVETENGQENTDTDHLGSKIKE